MEGFKSSLTSQQIEERLLKDGVGVIDVSPITNITPESSQEDIKAIYDSIIQQYRSMDGSFIASVNMQQDGVKGYMIIDLSIIDNGDSFGTISYSMNVGVKLGGTITKSNEYYFMSNYYSFEPNALIKCSQTTVYTETDQEISFSSFYNSPTLYTISFSGKEIANILCFQSNDNIYISPKEQTIFLDQNQYILKCTIDKENKKVYLHIEENING